MHFESCWHGSKPLRQGSITSSHRSPGDKERDHYYYNSEISVHVRLKQQLYLYGKTAATRQIIALSVLVKRKNGNEGGGEGRSNLAHLVSKWQSEERKKAN